MSKLRGNRVKLFFMSDIHGSELYLNKALEAFKREEAEQIIILGDELYHGPRNPLPEGYNPKVVAEILNIYKNQIIAIRGNCDSEVDQMVLAYPIMSDYITLVDEGLRFFITHGHIYNPENLPNLGSGDVFCYGHTHIPVAEKKDDIFIFNPGSTTLPKENNPNSYGIYENKKLYVKKLNGEIIKEISI